MDGRTDGHTLLTAHLKTKKRNERDEASNLHDGRELTVEVTQKSDTVAQSFFLR